MGDTSLGRMAIIPEVTAGVTPPTPAFLNLDFVSEDMSPAGNSIQSNTVTPQRVIRSSRRTSLEVGGGPTVELHHDPATHMLFEALLGNVFTANLAKAGGNLNRTLTFERQLLPTPTDFRRFVGCRVNSLDLTIQPEQFVIARWGIIGASMLTGNAIIAGATYAAATDTEKLTGLDVATISLANGLTGTFDYANITMQINNNGKTTKRVGASPVRGVVSGLTTVTGRLDIYIEDKIWADAFIAETPFDLTIPLLNNAKGYTFNLQNVKITGYSDGNEGNGNSFMAQVDYAATLDSTYASSLGVLRTV